jgi:hypothetical protein
MWANRVSQRINVSLRRSFGCQIFHFVGDSHLKSLLPALRPILRTSKVLCRSCIVEGATASGLPNPNSATQAGRKFVEYLQAFTAPADTKLFCLGEVDCGFIIWLRAQRNGTSPISEMRYALEHYEELLKAASAGRPERVLVLSAPLPTIRDNQQWGIVANARRDVRATIIQRTRLTNDFNSELKEICERRGFRGLFVNDKMIDPSTGIVHDKYLNENPLDHHMNPASVAPILISEFATLRII